MTPLVSSNFFLSEYFVVLTQIPMINMKKEKSYEYLSIKASFSNTEVVIGDGMSVGGKKSNSVGLKIKWTFD
jgi:hypothetical protein